MGVDYATTLTQALLQVLASYSMQCFSHSLVLISIPLHFIPISWLISFPFPLESHWTHQIPVFAIPMQISTSDPTGATHSAPSNSYTDWGSPRNKGTKGKRRHSRIPNLWPKFDSSASKTGSRQIYEFDRNNRFKHTTLLFKCSFDCDVWLYLLAPRCRRIVVVQCSLSFFLLF